VTSAASRKGDMEYCKLPEIPGSLKDQKQLTTIFFLTKKGNFNCRQRNFIIVVDHYPEICIFSQGFALSEQTLSLHGGPWLAILKFL